MTTLPLRLGIAESAMLQPDSRGGTGAAKCVVQSLFANRHRAREASRIFSQEQFKRYLIVEITRIDQ